MQQLGDFPSSVAGVSRFRCGEVDLGNNLCFEQECFQLMSALLERSHTFLGYLWLGFLYMYYVCVFVCVVCTVVFVL